MGQDAQIQLTQAPQFANELEAKLLRELREKSAQGRNECLAFELTGTDGVSLGGLSAVTVPVITGHVLQKAK